MRRLAARIMPFVEALLRPRTIGRRLRARPLAGLIAVGMLLAAGAHVLTRPDAGESHGVQVAAQSASGGETVVSKFARSKLAHAHFAQSKLARPARAEPEVVAAAITAEPTPAGRLLAMALAPVPSVSPPSSAEPSLEGLSEIPRELIWNRPPPDEEDEAKPKAFAAFSKARENLPWDATEPVPFSPLAPSSAPAKAAGAKPVAAIPQPPSLPDGGQVEAWVKAKATAIKGADRTRPLFHFEFWLEPPAAVKRRLVGVAYDFSTPAIRPQSQASSDPSSGFRISAGGLACADEITVTLTFDDGRAQKVAVDGCKLLS